MYTLVHQSHVNVSGMTIMAEGVVTEEVVAAAAVEEEEAAENRFLQNPHSQHSLEICPKASYRET